MADKKAPADGWPVISGDYIVGDPESPVAVTTLASHIEAELSGAAIAGPCKTENLGIEKVDKKKIIGATGAIPFVENVPLEGVERFQQQLEIVDLIDTEDVGAIQSKINECIEKDPGALEADPIVMEVDEENEKMVIVDKKKKDKASEEA